MKKPDNTNPKNEERAKILRLAAEKYFTEGFYKTPMDVLSSELGMSEETLYKHFRSKETIVEAVIDELTTSTAGSIDNILDSMKTHLQK